ncbi:MAG: hypothetical protein QMD22_11790 [archaeon]|nr:hypothetical protein [archaeon]
MTKERALELRVNILKELEEFLKGKIYVEIFVNLGRTYLLAIEGFEVFLPKRTRIIYAQGKIGQKMKEMKNWLLKIDKKSQNGRKDKKNQRQIHTTVD